MLSPQQVFVLSIGWYRLGYLWGAAYKTFKSMQKPPQKAHKRERKWSRIWNWWPLFIWTWITGHRFWGVPYRLWSYAVFVSFKVQGKCNFLPYCSVHPLILSATHILLKDLIPPLNCRKLSEHPVLQIKIHQMMAGRPVKKVTGETWTSQHATWYVKAMSIPSITWQAIFHPFNHFPSHRGQFRTWMERIKNHLN